MTVQTLAVAWLCREVTSQALALPGTTARDTWEGSVLAAAGEVGCLESLQFDYPLELGGLGSQEERLGCTCAFQLEI